MIIIRSIMKQAVNLPIPVIRVLHKLGKDISEARRKRKITLELMAERADLSRGTLSKIEKGDPTVSMGAYAASLFVLDLADKLAEIADAAVDTLGMQLLEEKLPKRVRMPRKKKVAENGF